MPGWALRLRWLCGEQVLHKIFPPPAPPVQTQGLGGAARKLSAVADTLSDIADTVNAVCQRQLPPKGETFDFVVEQVARTTCQSCTRRSRCWVRGYATAMDGLYHLKPTLESKGRVEVEDLPGQLAGASTRQTSVQRPTTATGCGAPPPDPCPAVTLRAALTEQYSALAGGAGPAGGQAGPGRSARPAARGPRGAAVCRAGAGRAGMQCDR